MRSQHFAILIGVGFIGWLALMYFSPTVVQEVSPYERLGYWVWILVAVGGWSGQLMFKLADRFSAPNLATTLEHARALDEVEVPIPESEVDLKLEFDNQNQLVNMSLEDLKKKVFPTTKFTILALGGTYLGPIKGGGRDNGYFVGPTDLFNYWEGERSQIRANVEYHVFCESPDKTKGERDLTELPGPIYERLKRHSRFHPKAPVYFGYYPWQKDDSDRERHRYLEIRVGMLESEIKKLKEERDNLLEASTKSARAFVDVTNAFGNNANNKTKEDKWGLKQDENERRENQR